MINCELYASCLAREFESRFNSPQFAHRVSLAAIIAPRLPRRPQRRETFTTAASRQRLEPRYLPW